MEIQFFPFIYFYSDTQFSDKFNVKTVIFQKGPNISNNHKFFLLDYHHVTWIEDSRNVKSEMPNPIG